MLHLLIKGMIIGFSIAAPVGPIGVLVIRRTLAAGRVVGFVSGLGAATADTLYGLMVAFGLTAVSDVLVDQQTAFRLIGGAFLVYLGIATFRARPAENAAAASQPEGNLRRAYLSTLALTLTNPATVLAFVAIVAGVGGTDDASSALSVVTGVFLGSAAWWMTLSTGLSLLRGSITPNRLRWINRFSGVILIGFGTFAGASAF